MHLAGDIGGTKTVVGLFEKTADGLVTHREETYSSKGHASLEEIVAKFLEKGTPLDGACFGVAGPVIDGKVKTTNLPWQLSESSLADTLGTRRVKLLNDLEAAAYGMLFLEADEFETLNAGDATGEGNIAVVAPGTGLGEAILYWDGKRYHPIACEGGHTDFGPRNPKEVALLDFLQKDPRHSGHVSYERILSGMGIDNLYNFLRETSGEAEPSWLTQRMAESDRSATISGAGLAGEDPCCVETLQLFANILGAEVGNLALKCLAKRAFVGGGIPPKVLPVLKSEAFHKGLLDKGRFSGYMQNLEVKVAMNSKAPLIGAAHFLENVE